MSAQHRRAARRERQAAELLGTRRVRRSRYESAPDVRPVTLPCGLVLMPEVKTRKALPALVTRALAQAKGYGPKGSVPVAVLSASGGEPLIVLPLRAFRVVAGLDGPVQSDPQTAIVFADVGDDGRSDPEEPDGLSPVFPAHSARVRERHGLASPPRGNELGPDERRVLAVLADRLRMGQRIYGPLDVAGDPRDWRREAAEEALDLAVYLAAELLRLADGGITRACERKVGSP